MPTPRFEITDRVQLFSGETGQVVDILEFDDRRNGYKYLVARGPSDRGQVWHEALMEEAHGHTPNRALNRAQLETIAWQVTPEDYRGGSGSRRTVLWNTPEGTTLMPLSNLTDNQIRKYIGPDALERGGDMKKNGSPDSKPKFRPGDEVTDLEGSMEGTVMGVTMNGPFDDSPYRCLVQETSDGRYRERPWNENQLKLLRGGPGSFDMRPNAKGIYAGSAAGNGDYAIHQHGTSGRYYADRVGPRGTHTQIGLSRGCASIPEALTVIEEDAIMRGKKTGAIFQQDGEELLEIDAVGPNFTMGDLVSRTDDPSMKGHIGYVGKYQGEEYGGYQYKVDWDNGAPRHYVPENKLRLMRGHESFSKNGARSKADETAARELSLYIENEYSLVGAPNSQGKAIEKNLLQKIRKGTFDLARSEDAWMHLMEAGAKKYAKEYASPKDWSVMFNKATRELVAHEFATTFYEEHKATGGLSRNGSVDDGDYVVQGMYSDGTICVEFGFDDEAKAVSEARKLLKVHGSTWFEGDRVRVITRDGELVYSSKE